MKMKKLITILAIVLTVQCVAQDSISWRKIWVRDIGQDSVEFNERIGIKKNGVTEYSFKTTYEKFVPAFKDDIISIQNYEANKSDLQRLIEYRRDNPLEELMRITSDSIIYIMGQRVVTLKDIGRYIEWCNDTIKQDMGNIAAFKIDPFDHRKWIEIDSIQRVRIYYPTITGFYNWFKQIK